jgi:hypothetical protein
MNSYDNMIDRKYCSEYNYTYDEGKGKEISDGNCLEYSYYTISEIENQVTEQINQRLKDYVNVSIERDNKVYEKASEGTIEVVEKK